MSIREVIGPVFVVIVGIVLFVLVLTGCETAQVPQS